MIADEFSLTKGMMMDGWMDDAPPQQDVSSEFTNEKQINKH